MRIHYNTKALKVLSDKDLRKIYNSRTTPTLEQVMIFLGRKVEDEPKPKKKGK